MTTQYVMLVLDVRDATGRPIQQGSAVIAPSGLLPDLADNLLVLPAPVVASFGNGLQQVRLISTDSIGPQPNGWTYTISFPGVPGNPPGFSFYLNYATGATQYLSSLAQVPAVVPGQSYLPLPSGTATAGYVPIATGTGEASTWGSPGSASLPLTTLGDTLYENATPTAARLPGNTTATRKFLRQQGNGTISAAPAWDTLQAGDIPNLSASYDVAGAAAAAQAAAEAASVPLSDLPISIANGGTGQVTQQAALDAVAGAVTTGQYLRGNGTHVQLSAIQAGDVPTLNQSTTGNAGTATNLAGAATFPAEVSPHVVTLTDAASVIVNASAGNDLRLLTTSGVGASRTIAAPSSPTDGQMFTIAIQQAASGGPYTVTWTSGAGGYSFGTDGAPTLSTAANAVDVIGFRYHAGLGKWLCQGWKLGFS